MTTSTASSASSAAAEAAADAANRPDATPARREAAWRVPFSYLPRQFADVEAYLDDVRRLVLGCDFTLGRDLERFEQAFAELCEAPFAVGVGSGTDAILLSLQAVGVAPGDEVLTAANTFIATVGAIVHAGATPRFVDSDAGCVMRADALEAAITPRTKAVVAVHLTGNCPDMDAIREICDKRGLSLVEDGCQAIDARFNDRPIGSWGRTACFSLHPLKNLNVWGDGGLIVTHDAAIADRLRLLRNHGLVSREEAAIWGRNSRLDTLQAVIGNRLIREAPFITRRRREIGARYDAALAGLEPLIAIPPRDPRVRHVFHLYVLRSTRRDELLAFLHERGVEAKIHYPIPMHLQPAAADLGYRRGDFPAAEADGRQILSLPCHEHLRDDELETVVAAVREFAATSR